MYFVYRNVLCLLFVVCILAACALSKAKFDTQNFHAIPISPYYFADPREDRIDHVWALTTIAAAEKPFMGFLKPNQMLLDPLYDFFIAQDMKPGRSLKGKESFVSTDACIGEYSVEVTSQADGSLKGTILYQNYSDNCSLIFDASLPFYGKIDPSTGVTTLSIQPDDLIGRVDSRGYSISGDLQLNMNVFKGPKQKYSADVNLSIEDELGSEYRLKNMLFTWDETGEYAKFSMAGLVDFSQFGNVEVATDGYLVSYEKNGRPFDGVIIYKGADESWLRLRFPKPTFPGFFKVDSFNGMETKGNF